MSTIIKSGIESATSENFKNRRTGKPREGERRGARKEKRRLSTCRKSSNSVPPAIGEREGQPTKRISVRRPRGEKINRDLARTSESEKSLADLALSSQRRSSKARTLRAGSEIPDGRQGRSTSYEKDPEASYLMIRERTIFHRGKSLLSERNVEVEFEIRFKIAPGS